MKLAAVLIMSVLVYLTYLDMGKQVATSQMLEIQYLYTSSDAQAAGISASSR